jgi:hypothetical protein
MLNFTKSISLCFVAVVAASGFCLAQQPSSPSVKKKLHELKSARHLTREEVPINQHPTRARITPPTPNTSGELCNCWITRDTTWSIVPFDCDGQNGGPGTAPEYRNDDWSACVGLPFTFCFYGQQIDSVFINNNGNVSIGTPNFEFTAIPFPDTTFPMIAPLWSDVDTRGPSSGLVYYKLTNQHLIVQWDGVDYYESDTTNNPTHLSLYNSYQLIMTDGTDPILPNGLNVSFCYQNMNWTTGDVSGTDGFGGDPATCGVNKGDGINYFQIGFYDAPGTAWDGPYGSNDGIGSLSNQSFMFNVCDSANTPPIGVANYVCDTLVLCVGDTGYVNVGYLSPEIGQTTTIVMDTTGLHGVTILSDSSANLAGINLQIIAQQGNAGIHLLYLNATDNGTPPKQTTNYIVVDIRNCGVGVTDPSIAGTLQLTPNPVNDNLTLNYYSSVSTYSTIEIRNALGEVMKKFDVGSAMNFTKTISVNDLPGGIYFVRVNTTHGVIQEKFIKQ